MQECEVEAQTKAQTFSRIKISLRAVGPNREVFLRGLWLSGKKQILARPILGFLCQAIKY